MTLKAVEYLKKYGLKKLEEEFFIKSNRHNEYPNLVLLKYSQIDSPKNHPIVVECRGIILDENDDWKVICRSFDRFYNYEEGCSYDIDFLEARVYKKLDGSLCQLYYYDNKWHVATSGTPDANGNVGDFDITFKKLFWDTWDKLGYKLPTEINNSYSFELMTPFNQVVIENRDSSIISLGARNLITQKELNPVVEAHRNSWSCVGIVELSGLAGLEEALDNMNGATDEGFVLCDGNYNRVKMKCSDYVLRHRLVSSLPSLKNMLHVIISGEGDEMLPKLTPQLSEIYWRLKCKYEYAIGEISGFYDGIKHIDDRKLFASFATRKWFSGALFNMKFNEVSPREFIKNIKNINNLMISLGIKNNQAEDKIQE